MERDGYVTKVVDSSDMRRKRIVLTDKGREVLAKLDEVYERIGVEMFNGFSKDEREQIADYFKRMIENLNRVSAESRAKQREKNP